MKKNGISTLSQDNDSYITLRNCIRVHRTIIPGTPTNEAPMKSNTVCHYFYQLEVRSVGTKDVEFEREFIFLAQNEYNHVAFHVQLPISTSPVKPDEANSNGFGCNEAMVVAMLDHPQLLPSHLIAICGSPNSIPYKTIVRHRFNY